MTSPDTAGAVTWYAIFRTSTGELLSLTTEQPVGLAEGLAFVALGQAPDDTVIWDEQGKNWKPRPAQVLLDRIADLSQDPGLGAVWTRLTTQQQSTLRARLGLLLGPSRFRRPDEPVDLG